MSGRNDERAFFEDDHYVAADQANPQQHRQPESEQDQNDTRAARITMLTQTELRNPYLVYLFHFIYNIAPITASIYILASTTNLSECHFPLQAFIIGCILTFAWRFCYRTYKFKLSVSWSRMAGTDQDQIRILNDILCLNRWETFDKFADFIILIWTVVGSYFVFNERVCNFDLPLYSMAFSLVIILYVEIIAPCLLILCILPFICCCPMSLLRVLGALSLDTGSQVAATATAIQELPTIKYTKSSYEDEKQCPICLVEFEEDELIRVLPCNADHIYHVGCIDEWLKINGICCVCRQPIVKTGVTAATQLYQNQRDQNQNQNQNQNQHQHINMNQLGPNSESHRA